MRYIILIISALLGLSTTLSAQYVGDAKAKDVIMKKNGNYMAVVMVLDVEDVSIKHDRAVLLTPTIVKGDSVMTLHSVGMYSHNRWYSCKRNDGHMISGEDEVSIRKSQLPDEVAYESVVPYREWMDGALLRLSRVEYGCCGRILDTRSALLARYDGPYVPDFLYITPDAEAVKTRFLSGTAYVDFPVSRTEIFPDYRNNVAELDKIRATIDSVRDDSDITIKAMTIKGFASPESPYANNARLAEGRTASLKRYICDLYHFPDELISTSFEPEDWAGLRRYVEKSSLPDKDAILELIDSDREPDNKEWKIKSDYKDQYRHLLDHCYPALRHSDYRIEYVIRSYTDVEEIARIIRTKPQNLSLNEFYAYAQTLEPGSFEFNEVFETAVRMYPDDWKANLNAANTAMSRGDLVSAGRYLDKAGDSPEAEYARACYAYLEGDTDKALEIYRTVLDQGVTSAAKVIERIEKERTLTAE